MPDQDSVNTPQQSFRKLLQQMRELSNKFLSTTEHPGARALADDLNSMIVQMDQDKELLDWFRVGDLYLIGDLPVKVKHVSDKESESDCVTFQGLKHRFLITFPIRDLVESGMLRKEEADA